jgi:hypothetical protein
MNDLAPSIIGFKIHQILYSEVNHHQGTFYYSGFHTFDHGINIQMESGYWWHWNWNEDEYFELAEGKYLKNNYIDEKQVKIWDATEEWTNYLGLTITDVQIEYIDDEQLIPSACILHFENQETISIMIGLELNTDGTFPVPFEIDFTGELYVIFDKTLQERARQLPGFPPSAPEPTNDGNSFLYQNSAGLRITNEPGLTANEIDSIEQILYQFRDSFDKKPAPTDTVTGNAFSDCIDSAVIMNPYEEINLYTSLKLIQPYEEAHLIVAKLLFATHQGRSEYRFDEPQLIGIKRMNKDFGHILLRPETFEDKVIELFIKTEYDFGVNPRFSSRYYFLSDSEYLAREFASTNRLSLLENMDGLLLEICGKILIARFPRTMNAEDCASMIKLLNEI